MGCLPPYITQLNENDVLMGRGAPSAEYEGNLRLRQIVIERRQEYLKYTRRVDKHEITKEIIDQVHSCGGRFLVRIATAEEADKFQVPPRTQAWRVIAPSSSALFVKVKQLMRDVGPETQQKRKIRRIEKRNGASPTEGQVAASVKRDSPKQSSVPSSVTYENVQFRNDSKNKQMEELCTSRQDEFQKVKKPAPSMQEQNTQDGATLVTSNPQAGRFVPPLAMQILGLLLQQQQEQQIQPPPRISPPSPMDLLSALLGASHSRGAVNEMNAAPPVSAPNPTNNGILQDPQILLLLAQALNYSKNQR